MADSLDTQVPPWLERNWAPRQTFDPTPWLQERYARQIQEQTIPLQVQGMNLANQQAQLKIQETAMANELRGVQMQQYSAELPQFQELAHLAVTDPEAFRNKPASFMNPQLAQQYTALRQAVAQTDYGIAAQKRIASDIETAAAVAKETGYVIKRLPDGSFDPADFELGVQTLAQHRQENFQTRFDKSLAGGNAITPVVQNLDVNGKKIPVVVNPKTGHFMPVSSLTHVSEADRSEIMSNRARIAQLWKAHDSLAPEVGAVASHPNTLARMRISTEIARLKERNRELDARASGAPQSQSSADFEFVPGKGLVPVQEPEPTEEPTPTE